MGRRVLSDVAERVRPGQRVGVDGVDGAGKTTFADELADVLRDHRIDVVRICLDDFHRQRAIRHRRGRTSPSGYWADGFDYDRLWTDVLHPFGPDGNRTYRAHDRAPGRNAADPEHPAVRRYVEAQRRYLAQHRPRERADVVIDNGRFDSPRVLRASWISGRTDSDDGQHRLT
jgi:uridine kinase